MIATLKNTIYIFLVIISFSSCKSRYNYMLSADKENEAQSRHVAFDDVVNLRDLGTLPTKDDRIIKKGLIYRSDNLSGLRSDEFTRFSGLGIKEVIDLRTQYEADEKPDHLPKSVTYKHIKVLADKDNVIGGLRDKVIKGEVSEKESQELMEYFYAQMMEQNLPVFKELVHEVLDADEPILYHCTAGKDRTGVLTALVLEVLKVKRNQIDADYLLSNYFRQEKINHTLRLAGLAKVIHPHLDLKTIENFMKTDESYLDAVYTIIDEKYDGMDAFIKNQLGISDEQREQYIEKFTIPKEQEKSAALTK
ncbi:tyrosine-protein phosphatase [Zhouia sp. PK063]|uniref:tyrosine-protein phosphatase n=1 Tax=Zhouia sp. PK063 TaxID=3373602 RepID=UPI00378F1F3F